MIPLIVILTLIEASLIVFSCWVGFKLHAAGYDYSALGFGLVIGCLLIAKTSRLVHNLLQENAHRRKHFSDLPTYRWWSTKSQLFDTDSQGRRISSNEIRRTYR